MRVLALCLCAAVMLPRPFEHNDTRVAAALDAVRVKHHLPALGGAIVTSKGVTALAVTGVRKAGTDAAATPDDLWHLGSDTKAMTAAWIARIVERGKLSWDSTIGDVLRTETAGAPEAFRDITLLQLLSHRAGLAANVNWQEASRSAPTPRAQRLAALRTAAARHEVRVLESRLRDCRDDG